MAPGVVAAVAGFPRKSDLAYARVRELILSGALPPGSTLNQAGLAHTLGLSTTPLREALRRLKEQGLVELDAHRDARVAPLDPAEARDLLELRRSLDPLAAGLAADRRTAADITELRASLAGLESLPTHPSAAQLATHRRFHAAIYRASHNGLLVETLDGLWDKSDRYRRHGLELERTEEERERRAEEHQLLVDTVLDRDGAAATELMQRHVEESLGARAVRRLSPAGPGDRTAIR